MLWPLLWNGRWGLAERAADQPGEALEGCGGLDSCSDAGD